MAYLMAAIVMTLSVFEGHSLLQSFQVWYFVFVAHYMVPLHLQGFLFFIMQCWWCWLQTTTSSISQL